MATKIKLYEQLRDSEYTSGDCNYVVKRDWTGVSPNGNPFNGVWVLSVDGVYVDHDQFRYDLAERNNLDLIH